MSRKADLLRVFVASPDDVKKERKQLESIINEVNKEIGSNSGVQFELVKYETDVAPGVGGEPQDVIDKEINDEYDIFIGILWKKFGTPTKNSLSGTESEFNRAYERNTMSPGIVDIKIYFKDARIKPDEIEPAQIALIKDFRKNLGGKGVLWDTYTTMPQFEKKMRMHLHAAVRAFQKNKKSINADKARNQSGGVKRASRATSDQTPAWELLFEHDENGTPIKGNIDSLIRAAIAGHPVRISVHHQNGVIQVMDAPLLSVEKGVVHASDIDQVSKTRDASGNYIYQEKSYHYYVIASSNGHFHAKRIFFDGVERNTTNDKRHIAWFGSASSNR